MQTKELEDARAAAEQKLAHLQTQLDDTAALNQSRAAELAAAQASLESLQSEIQSLRGKLAQADIDLTASKEAQTAGGTSAAEKEQQLVTQASHAHALCTRF